MLLTSNGLHEIFSKCIEVLNIKFTIAGVSVSLMGFILFDVVSVLLLTIVLSLFNGK